MQSNNKEKTEISIRQSGRKRASTASHSIPLSVSPKKKRRRNSNVFPSNVLKLIYRLSKPLNKCTGLLAELHAMTEETPAHTAIQDMQEKIEEAIDIKC